MRTFAYLVIASSALVFSGCSTTSSQSGNGHRYAQKNDAAPTNATRIDLANIPRQVPKDEPRSRYGNHSPYTVNGQTYEVMPNADGYSAEGLASWYGSKFQGYSTSSGEPYDMYQFTAAHRSLPLPTYALVTNLDNQESIVVKINDRGPFHPNREIDLSWAAAEVLGIAQKGVGRVHVAVISPSEEEEEEVEVPSFIELDSSLPDSEPNKPINKPKLYLQVGAFSKHENARASQVQLLELLEHPVTLHSIEDEKGTLYRVWVGPFFTENERTSAQEELRLLGHKKPQKITSK